MYCSLITYNKENTLRVEYMLVLVGKCQAKFYHYEFCSVLVSFRIPLTSLLNIGPL